MQPSIKALLRMSGALSSTQDESTHMYIGTHTHTQGEGGYKKLGIWQRPIVRSLKVLGHPELHSELLFHLSFR